MQRIIQFFLKLALILGVCVIAAGSYGYYQYDKSMHSAAVQQETKFFIKRGRGLRMVAQDLTQLGILEHPWYFVLHGYLQGKETRIQAGEYSLTANMTPAEILVLFVNGKVAQYRFTIIEGWTTKQLLAELKRSELIKQTMADVKPKDMMQTLGFGDLHPEGQFLPETYWFVRGTTDRDILKRSHLALNEVLSEAWQNRDPNIKLRSSYEALIMASIIEKETGVAHERPKISGVFNRRLKLGMRLQTDPTVIYGMGESYDGNIRRKDLRTDTPYNTYTRSGLPPTPIALASEASIRAAVHPLDGDELYFVATGTNGEHYFSSTIEEHNAAVRKYQLKRRDK